MGSAVTGTLDEAYERLHATGPEFDGWLSNHGPMAAEAMVRHGHSGQVHRWLDGYMRRLEEFPRGSGPIGPDWREALGDPRRIADWTAYFRREVTGQPWRQALGTWWPRLLPGVAAAATHGVIRVGHAVRALTEDGEDAEHLTELAHGLTGRPAGSRYLVPPPPSLRRKAPAPQPGSRRRAASRAKPGRRRVTDRAELHRRPLRRCRPSPGSPTSPAAFANACPGWRGSPAGLRRWQRRSSPRRPKL
jgi:hypothetical protein